jgi:ABC-type cobalamin transport system permease subunit
LPVAEAQYYALLSRAFHGGVSRQEMRWQVSLAEGWAMIHAAGLLAGEAYIWPDPRLSSSGRALLRVRDLREAVRRGEWVPEVDL